MNSNSVPPHVAVPPIVRTPRLTLRVPRTGDGRALAEAVAESFDDLLPWFHDGMGPRHVEGDAAWQEGVARRFRSQFENRERFPYLVWAAGALIGFIELFPDRRIGAMKLSYWVRSSRTRQGFAAEAANALTRSAFSCGLGARGVHLHHTDGNVASAAVASRLGFRIVGRIVDGFECPDGSRRDQIERQIDEVGWLPPMDVSFASEDP